MSDEKRTHRQHYNEAADLLSGLTDIIDGDTDGDALFSYALSHEWSVWSVALEGYPADEIVSLALDGAEVRS